MAKDTGQNRRFKPGTSDGFGEVGSATNETRNEGKPPSTFAMRDDTELFDPKSKTQLSKGRQMGPPGDDPKGAIQGGPVPKGYGR